MPKKKTPKTTAKKQPKPEFGAKSEFIRARPHATAKELIQMANNEGLRLTANHIYNTRTADKKKGIKGSKTNATGTTMSSSEPALEAQLQTVVIRMGLDKADAIFSALRARLLDFEPQPPATGRRKAVASAPTASASVEASQANTQAI